MKKITKISAVIMALGMMLIPQTAYAGEVYPNINPSDRLRSVEVYKTTESKYPLARYRSYYADFSYDSAGNLVKVTSGDNLGTNRSTTFEYDESGKLTGGCDQGTIPFQHEYDEAGNSIQQSTPYTKTTYELDENGRIRKIIYPLLSDSDDILSRTISLTYDSNGGCFKPQPGDISAPEIVYDEAGRFSRIDHQTFQYDEAGRISTIVLDNSVPLGTDPYRPEYYSQYVDTSNYQYDEAGNLKSIIRICDSSDSDCWSDGTPHHIVTTWEVYYHYESGQPAKQDIFNVNCQELYLRPYQHHQISVAY